MHRTLSVIAADAIVAVHLTLAELPPAWSYLPDHSLTVMQQVDLMQAVCFWVLSTTAFPRAAAQSAHTRTADCHGCPAMQVQRGDLLEDEEYEDIRDDIYWEIQDKYGAIASIQVPRPGSAQQQDPAGVGLVFVAFQTADSAAAAQAGLHRRLFGDNRVDAQLYDQLRFDSGLYI